MVKEKLVVVKEANLTNNCPECFNQELKLTFFQKHTYGSFYDKSTKEITHEIKCNTCSSDIYPIAWTQDIERVYDYYRKMVTPKKATIKFTKLFYSLVLFLIVSMSIGVYFYIR
ncbi:hypothetical protein HCG49_06330 [Arenibacter sp. 6A1]|uniref:hypothetical protein n=1 Tax=Arenibacter sp. 6A1 TaxID=2720391 RepID=UPI0014475F15|nr:hypothetical protein [Arenibacter sp. 6A1]NKI26172.1 hypothetical protein [Arenibacter sp. 6A1]